MEPGCTMTNYTEQRTWSRSKIRFLSRKSRYRNPSLDQTTMTHAAWSVPSDTNVGGDVIPVMIDCRFAIKISAPGCNLPFQEVCSESEPRTDWFNTVLIVFRLHVFQILSWNLIVILNENNHALSLHNCLLWHCTSDHRIGRSRLLFALECFGMRFLISWQTNPPTIFSHPDGAILSEKVHFESK